MNSQKMLAGSILLLAVGLLANAAALWMRPAGAGVGAMPLVSLAEAQPRNDAGPIYYLLGRSTYLITSSSEGDEVFLWYYNFSPNRRDNKLEFVNKAGAQ